MKTLLLFPLLFNVALAADPTYTEANNRYGLQLLKSLSKKEEGKNICFSPVASLALLAQHYAGLDPRTRQEIRRQMDWRDDGESLHDGYKALTDSMPKGTFGISHRLFVQEGIKFSKDYEDVLRKYDTKIDVVDWANDRLDMHAERINDAVKSTTKGKVLTLMSKDRLEDKIKLHLGVSSAPIVPLTIVTMKLALNRAIESTPVTFRNWHDSDASIRPGARIDDNFKLYSAANHKIAELAFEEKDFAVDFIVPDERISFDKWISELSLETLEDGLSRMKPTSGPVTFPNLRLSSSLSTYRDFPGHVRWNEIDTKRMGDPGAFLTIDIADIPQDFQFELSGKGTEAAAATAMTIGGVRTLVIPASYFHVNRPHLILIRNLKTGTYLVMAKVSKL